MDAVPELAAAREGRRALRDELTRACDERTSAAVGHALQFATWRSLVRHEGLSQRAVVDLVLGLAFGERQDS